MSEVTQNELYAVADCQSYPPLLRFVREMGLMISLPNSNGIRDSICRTSDCRVSEGLGEVWAGVQGMSG